MPRTPLLCRCPECQTRFPADGRACTSCGRPCELDPDQYRRLAACGETGDVSDWSSWRRQGEVPVRLEGAVLDGAQLGGVDLYDADLRGADLSRAYLADADLRRADMAGCCLEDTDLTRANMAEADMCGASLGRTVLHRTTLSNAGLSKARVVLADMSESDLSGADLTGTIFRATDLSGVRASQAIVDGSTVIADCTVDDRTVFQAVSLASARIDPQTRAYLEYNLRRAAWRAWYSEHPLMRLFAWPFWQTSDYGRSTFRILVVFVVLSVAFAGVYYWAGLVHPPGVVTNLFEVDGVPVPHLLVPLRAVYFSVVTMTTLGFGEMHAAPSSYVGHALLVLQVVAGYVLLGALITRFAVMFHGSEVPWARVRRRAPGPEEEPADGRGDSSPLRG
jgi:hypothetical protein